MRLERRRSGCRHIQYSAVGSDNRISITSPLEDPARQATRMRIIDAIESAAGAKAEAARFAYEAALPDSVKLANAIMMDDESEIKALVAKGVRLDTYPRDSGSPLVMAIGRHNVAAVRHMIELGAAVTRRGPDGMKLLQFSRQMQQGLRMSQRLQQEVLGDLSTMADGAAPPAGGLMSMLQNLQSGAADLLSQMDGHEHTSPLRNEDEINARQQDLQATARETTDALSQLDEIVNVLEMAAPRN
jgi:hypothetical protein